MSLRATVYQISPLAFKAACAGDYESFGNEDMGDPLHIEHDWHLIYYLLTGDTDLLLFPAGIEIEIMSEYSEVHSPESLLQLNNRLETIMNDRDVQGLDIETLNAKEIYPRDWQRDPRADVESHLVAISAFIRKALNRGYGLFVFIA